MKFKQEILDLVDAHLVMYSLIRNDENNFSTTITDKLIEIKRNNWPYLKIWFGEPVVIRFGEAYRWRKQPPKKFGVITSEGYSGWYQLAKFDKFDKYKTFFEGYVM